MKKEECIITKEELKRRAKVKQEPDWLVKLRIEALEEFWRLRGSGPEISGLDLWQLKTYTEANQKERERLPRTIEKLRAEWMERELGGLGIQYNFEMIFHEKKEEGIIYLPMSEAVLNKKIEPILREKLMSLVETSEYEYAALHATLWSGGSFVYVPRGVKVKLPLEAVFWLEEESAGQIEHTVIILEEGAELSFIERCGARKCRGKSLHLGATEIFIGRGAKLKYVTEDRFGNNVNNLSLKRIEILGGGSLEWVARAVGSGRSVLMPKIDLSETHASFTYYGSSVAGEGQKLDMGVKVRHLAEQTYSYIDARSVVKETGESIFRSKIRVEKKKARSFVDCRSLMLGPRARSETVPELEVLAKEVEVGHEAKVGRIDDRELKMLRRLGLEEEEARELIVKGFMTVEMDELMKRGGGFGGY